MFSPVTPSVRSEASSPRPLHKLRSSSHATVANGNAKTNPKKAAANSTSVPKSLSSDPSSPSRKIKGHANKKAPKMIVDPARDNNDTASGSNSNKNRNNSNNKKTATAVPNVFTDALTSHKLQRICGTVSLSTVSSLSIQVDSSRVTLSELPSFLPSLTSLTLDGSRVDTLRDLGTGFRNLTTISIEGLGLKDLEGFGGLGGLREARVRGNFIEDLTPLALHPTLSTLDISHNLIHTLHPLTMLATLPSLTSLDLRGNFLQTELSTPQFNSISTDSNKNKNSNKGKNDASYRTVVGALVDTLEKLDGRSLPVGSAKTDESKTDLLIERASDWLKERWDEVGPQIVDSKTIATSSKKAVPPSKTSPHKPNSPPSLNASPSNHDNSETDSDSGSDPSLSRRQDDLVSKTQNLRNNGSNNTNTQPTSPAVFSLAGITSKNCGAVLSPPTSLAPIANAASSSSPSTAVDNVSLLSHGGYVLRGGSTARGILGIKEGRRKLQEQAALSTPSPNQLQSNNFHSKSLLRADDDSPQKLQASKTSPGPNFDTSEGDDDTRVKPLFFKRPSTAVPMGTPKSDLLHFTGEEGQAEFGKRPASARPGLRESRKGGKMTGGIMMRQTVTFDSPDKFQFARQRRSRKDGTGGMTLMDISDEEEDYYGCPVPVGDVGARRSRFDDSSDDSDGEGGKVISRGEMKKRSQEFSPHGKAMVNNGTVGEENREEGIRENKDETNKETQKLKDARNNTGNNAADDEIGNSANNSMPFPFAQTSSDKAGLQLGFDLRGSLANISSWVDSDSDSESDSDSSIPQNQRGGQQQQSQSPHIGRHIGRHVIKPRSALDIECRLAISNASAVASSETAPDGTLIPAPQSPSSDSSLEASRRNITLPRGPALSMSDAELIALLRKQPKTVPEISTRDSFRRFFARMKRDRFEFLLRAAGKVNQAQREQESGGASFSKSDVSEKKVYKRLGLVKDVLL